MARKKILIIACALIVAGVIALVFINSGKRVDNMQDESIAGADADGDGLWDYVQKYIDETYSNDPAKRAGLTQYAKNVQQAILSASDRTASIAAGNGNSRAVECLFYIFGGEATIDASDALLAEILNTDARSRAYLQYNKNLGGEVFDGRPRSQRRFSCEFDPDAFMGKK